jgi:hypothetical protein
MKGEWLELIPFIRKSIFFRDTVLLKLLRIISQPNSMLWCGVGVLVSVVSLNITNGHNNNNNNNSF